MHVFYSQVRDFCELMLAEIAGQMSHVPEPPASAGTAMAFTEKFLLCPTTDSARECIQRDLPGALNFAMALDAANRRIQSGLLQLPSDPPTCQTRFYVLCSIVQEHLRSLRR
jgi:hypothetical protein